MFHGHRLKIHKEHSPKLLLEEMWDVIYASTSSVPLKSWASSVFDFS